MGNLAVPQLIQVRGDGALCQVQECFEEDSVGLILKDFDSHLLEVVEDGAGEE